MSRRETLSSLSHLSVLVESCYPNISSIQILDLLSGNSTCMDSTRSLISTKASFKAKYQRPKCAYQFDFFSFYPVTLETTQRLLLDAFSATHSPKIDQTCYFHFSISYIYHQVGVYKSEFSPRTTRSALLNPA